jgi:hypothetical protein
VATGIAAAVNLVEKMGVTIATKGEASHCTENPIYVFPEMKLHGLVPSSYSHVSVSDLYFPRIGLRIWLHQNTRRIQGTYKPIRDT